MAHAWKVCKRKVSWVRIPHLPPEDVRAMWDSIHNKICVPIEISEEE